MTTIMQEVKRIQQIKRDLQAKRDALFEIPVDQISEEEEEKLFNEINCKIDRTINAEFDAGIPFINLNDWGKTYFESFADCDKQKITLKQASVFEKYLKYVETKHNTNNFHSKTYASCKKYAGNYNGKIYEVSVFSNCGYLTKRNVITI